MSDQFECLKLRKSFEFCFWFLKGWSEDNVLKQYTPVVNCRKPRKEGIWKLSAKGLYLIMMWSIEVA